MKEQRIFSDEGVLKYMREHADTRYEVNIIAKRFGVKTESMSAVIQRLVANKSITCGTDGRRRYYIFETNKKEERVYVPPPFRPLKGYEAMMRKFARNAEEGR